MVKTLLKIAVVAGLLGAAPTQASSLLGATVRITARYPNASTIYFDPGMVVVTDASIEYPVGTFATYNSTWQIDVFGNHLTITDMFGNGLPFGAGVFNGFVLEVLTGPKIASAVIDSGGTIVPASAIVSNGDLFINFVGVSQQDFGTAIVNFTTLSTAVPEPASWAMLIAGFGLTGATLRRRRAVAA
jgi:PEP-CTERM motif